MGQKRQLWATGWPTAYPAPATVSSWPLTHYFVYPPNPGAVPVADAVTSIGHTSCGLLSNPSHLVLCGWEEPKITAVTNRALPLNQLSAAGGPDRKMCSGREVGGRQSAWGRGPSQIPIPAWPY